MNCDIVITNYNKIDSIVGVVISALQVPNVRNVIVLDDGSHDGSLQLLEDLECREDRLTLIKNICNQGVATSRNKLLTHTDADYICFVDGDDTLIPDAKAAQIEYTIINKLDLCYSAYIKISTRKKKVKSAPEFQVGHLMKANIIPFSSSIVRREAVCFHFKPEHHEDYLFWLENIILGDINKVSYFCQCTFFYTYRVKSLSGNLFKNLVATYNIQRKFSSRLKVIRNLLVSYLLQGISKRI